MIGQDDPNEVLQWIQERITCHIPSKESDPELYNLVTRYQMHKCSGYCMHKRNCGKSATVKWIHVSMPQERSHGLKDH